MRLQRRVPVEETSQHSSRGGVRLEPRGICAQARIVSSLARTVSALQCSQCLCASKQGMGSIGRMMHAPASALETARSGRFWLTAAGGNLPSKKGQVEQI